jgi:hypothetical protein
MEHFVGGASVHAALSRRADGPLVVGTRALQAFVYPGGRVRLPGSGGGVVVHYLARLSDEGVAYVVAEAGVALG